MVKIANPAHFFKGLHKPDSLTVGATLLASLSFGTTALGAFTMLKPNVAAMLGADASDSVALILALAGSGILQLLIVGGMKQWAAAPRQNLTPLFVALVMIAMSWFGGAAGWHLSLNGAGMASQKSAAEAAALASPLAKYAADYAATVGSITVLSERMAALAKEEANFGGTCGRPAAAVAGPAARLRAMHADRLKQVAVEAEGYSRDVRTAATAVVAAGSSEGQRAAWAAAAELETSPTPARVAATLNDVAGELSGAAWRDPTSGKRLVCRDPQLAQSALALANAATARPAIGLAPPKAATVDVGNAASCVYNQLRTVGATDAEGCPAAVPAMVGQGTMEFLLAMMLVSTGFRQRRLRLVRTERDQAGFPQHMKPNDPAAVELARRVVAAVRTNVITTKAGLTSRVFLVAEPKDDCPGAWLAEYYLMLDEPNHHRVPLASFAPYFAERFESPSVDIFVLDQTAKAEIRLAREVLRQAGPEARRCREGAQPAASAANRAAAPSPEQPSNAF